MVSVFAWSMVDQMTYEIGIYYSAKCTALRARIKIEIVLFHYKNNLLKLLGQLEPNFAGMIFVRSYTESPHFVCVW